MLQKLKIQNYAIIDELGINFSEKLNIITGETGAGKSILMGALDLVLGKRADTAVLKSKEIKCIVEASFTVKQTSAIKLFFEENDLDVETEILIRREIAPNGKSRSFINDTPVNLLQLKELTSNLVDLHRQFDTLEIGSQNFQKEVIDALADNGNLLVEIKNCFASYTAAKKELDTLKAQQASAEKELDYNKFLLEEFTDINLKENELEELDAELKLLSNAENIKLQLSSVYAAISNGDEPLAQNLKSLAQKLNGLKEFNSGIEDLQKRLIAAQIEIQDVADELEKTDSSILYDEERINEVNERLSQGYKLQKKHGVTSTMQLLQLQNELQLKLDVTLNITHKIEALEKLVLKHYDEANKIAVKINANRTKQVKPFEKNVNDLLTQIGMPNAQIKVEITPTALSETGSDEINFLFDANKTNRFEPLHKVASGGELSRLMLSVKSLVAQKLQLPVLIFDEIDTGISGEAAKQVGVIMKNLSDTHQIICITHQPQIAAKANAHYFVYKQTLNNAIHTSVKLLTIAERKTAIAQMLGGENPSEAALANATEMMEN
jgi:DNA repair protein RecN (Recombination protein N)